MESDWIRIFETSEYFKADIIRGMLEENNIEVITMNKKDAFIHFGSIELYVFRDNAVKAHILLLDFNFEL